MISAAEWKHRSCSRNGRLPARRLPAVIRKGKANEELRTIKCARPIASGGSASDLEPPPFTEHYQNTSIHESDNDSGASPCTATIHHLCGVVWWIWNWLPAHLKLWPRGTDREHDFGMVLDSAATDTLVTAVAATSASAIEQHRPRR